MKRLVECWFWGPERYRLNGGRESDFLLKEVTLEYSIGEPNPPLLSIEIDGRERMFYPDGEPGNIIFYRMAEVQKVNA